MTLFSEPVFRTHYSTGGNRQHPSVTMHSDHGKYTLMNANVTNTLECHLLAVHKFIRKQLRNPDDYKIRIGHYKDDYYFIVEDWT